MSIFGSIKKAIFGDHGPLGGQFSGHKDHPAQPQSGQAQPQPTPAAPQAAQPAPAAHPAPAQPAAAQPVNVEQRLTDLAHQKGDSNLNWRTSVVDLLKLLDLDSSLAARKQLAEELNVHAGADGSPEQNMALQQAVMRQLDETKG